MHPFHPEIAGVNLVQWQPYLAETKLFFDNLEDMLVRVRRGWHHAVEMHVHVLAQEPVGSRNQVSGKDSSTERWTDGQPWSVDSHGLEPEV